MLLIMSTFIRPEAAGLSFFSSRKPSLVSKAKACSLSTANSTCPKAERPLLHSSIPTNMNTHRRSGNYKPPAWSFEYIQSINNDYVGENYTKQFNKLKEEMRKKLMVDHIDGQELEKLELIDNLQRLGLSYHFKKEIFQILRSIHQQQIQQEGRNVVSGEYSLLYATSLKFKLLREHGFDISQDTLNSFNIEEGNFKESLGKDPKGLLQLYEASFFATQIENTLKSTTRVTKSELKNYLENYEPNEENVTATLVRHALELPSHWRMLRLETRWFINVYEKMPNANPLLLELAKLDFNIVQATHQEELRDVSRWWKKTCLAEKLPFSRDRLVECFFWAVGMILFEPQQGHCRINLAKINALVTTLDDIYDIYGTYHELQLFTDTVERWDLKAMEQLPEYMKVMYLTLFNTINEIAYEVLKEQGINVLPYLTKSVTDLCKAYLLEARWYYNGYKPTLQEYMNNAWISAAMPMILTHAFFLVTNPITKEELESLSKVPDIIRLSSTIVRFADDLGTSSDELKRGDVPKSIQCYINETGVSEEEAREHIQYLIKETWEMMNKAQRENLLFSGTFVEIAKNTARTAQCMYLHGDGHGIQNTETKNSISKIFFEHIRVPNPS